ncbi:O-acyltransferase [Abeliophyllum distichum]|uniref:O-acyltransferase n=1 Tax=Abeliophyllum distichum TaxID=126358 RepID=A0ABD1U3B3_9LAMI
MLLPLVADHTYCRSTTKTTTSNTHHSRDASTVRRRSSAVEVLELESNSLEAINDSDGDVNNNNGMGNLCGGVVELVWKKPSEYGTEGLNNGKEEEKEKICWRNSRPGHRRRLTIGRGYWVCR